MSALYFDPKTHLAAGDCRKLKEVAAAKGMSVGDFMEATLKRAIWLHSKSPRQASKKKGASQ